MQMVAFLGLFKDGGLFFKRQTKFSFLFLEAEQEVFYGQEAETVKSLNCRGQLYFLFTNQEASTGV